MKRIFFDFETYWADEYTLSKMTPLEYILDPRWQTVGCGVAINSDKPFWLPRDEVQDFLRSINEPYMAISHNALFDASILAYRYGIHPDLCIDTMGMARAILMAQLSNGRVSLENTTNFLGIGEKGKAVLLFKNMTVDEIERDRRYILFKEYCLNDVELCRQIYIKLVRNFPASEHIIMDMIIRTTTQLQMQLNMDHLNQHLAFVQNEKQELLNRINCTKDDLMSNPKFAKVLRDVLGVDPPTKISPTTGELTWAFAKSDSEFTALLEHDDADVQALVAARLGHKSTLEETRTKRFINIGNATINSYGETYMPMALRYAGTHTHRFSGDWSLNTQNLPARKSKRLRESFIVPAGYVILEVDAAQIEARLVAWFAKQMNLLRGFEQGRDVYKEFAIILFQCLLENVTKIQRFVSKECVLGLGFQLGPAKLLRTLIFKAQDQGILIEEPFTLEKTKEWVDTFRNRHNDIKNYWYYLNNIVISALANGTPMLIRGCCKVEHERIILPSGLSLYYHNLRKNDSDEWIFDYGRMTKKLYGGKLLENIVQAFDRMIVMDAAIRVYQRTGYRIVHQMHDALLYLVTKSDADALSAIVVEEMTRRPKWGLDLPLKAEAKIGTNYGNLEEK